MEPSEQPVKAHRVRSYAIYGAIMSVVCAVCYFAIRNGWEYGLSTFMTILFFIAVFIIMERIIPFEEKWHPTWKEWLRDATYFFLTCFWGASGQAVVTSMSLHFTEGTFPAPLWGEVPIALLIASFGGYWFHRIGHVSWYLWQVHGIHHIPEKVNLANNSVVNFFDVIAPAIITQAPLVALGFSGEAIFITSVFTAVQGYFIHANIDVRLGRLSYVVATPEAHRLHHSVDLKEAGNFGSDLVVWDLIFRSFTWREHRVPTVVGMEHKDKFPRTEAIIRSTLHPILYLFKRVRKRLNRRSSKGMKKANQS